MSKAPDPSPRPAATPFGTVMLLAKTGDLTADVHAAVVAAGSALTAESTDARIHDEYVARALRAEAGYATGPMTSVLESSIEDLASGIRLSLILLLSQTTAGDAVYWNVTVSNCDEAICFATRSGAEAMQAIIRTAAGGGGG